MLKKYLRKKKYFKTAVGHITDTDYKSGQDFVKIFFFVLKNSNLNEEKTESIFTFDPELKRVFVKS